MSGGLMRATRPVIILVAVAGLAVDAVVHARLSGQYDGVSAAVSEGTLFRIEAVVAALAAVMTLVWRHWISEVLGWCTALAGVAAVLVYRYIDVGAFGPFPDMYEPIWSPDKYWSLAGEAAALLAFSWLLWVRRHNRELSAPAGTAPA